MEILKKIFRDAIKVISNPVCFYRGMPKKGGFVEPVLFMSVMTIIGYVFEFAMSVFGLGALLGVFDLEPDELVYLFLFLILALVGLTLVIFSFYGILFVIWKLMGSKESYETAFRCGAYSTAIVPVLTLMEIIPLLYAFGAFFWYFYLVLIASEEVHKVNSEVALFGFLIIFTLYWTLPIYFGSH